MSRRDNSDLNRPLLPRSGRIARVIALNEQFGQKKTALQQRWRWWLARRGAGRFQHQLDTWKLEGDAPVGDYGQIAAKIQTAPVVFLGVSRLAYYLAHRGQPVTIYDPFQGYFNADVGALFNSQFADAQTFCTALALGERLTLCREGVDQAALPGGATQIIISARFMSQVWLDTLRRLLADGHIQRVLVLLDPAWPDTYRAAIRQQLEPLLDVHEQAVASADVYILS